VCLAATSNNFVYVIVACTDSVSCQSGPCPDALEQCAIL